MFKLVDSITKVVLDSEIDTIEEAEEMKIDYRLNGISDDHKYVDIIEY